MARVVILGAGISGHTAALHLKRRLKRSHEVIVVSPNANWNWIPSNIWVGVGRMTPAQVTFPLRPVYRRKGIDFRQALAVAIRPEGDGDDESGSVDIVYTDPTRLGQEERLTYGFLINATGPKLNFAATPGLGPDGNSLSVCTARHAEQTAGAFDRVVDALRRGERQTLVIGVGHGTCTCEGAAFEYTFNIEHELREQGVRELADVVYLTNEYDLGDFGVGGMSFEQNGFVTSSKMWTESLFRERNVRAILRAHVERVDPGVIHYEQLDGTKGTLAFDFAMLLPPFRGADLKAYDRQSGDITNQLFAPNGFLRVDADYEAKPFEEWKAEDWPSTYQSHLYGNLFGVGIAFAPPHPISRPRSSPDWDGHLPGPTSHRHALRRHGAGGGPFHRRQDRARGDSPPAHCVDGVDGSRLHRVRRRRHAYGNGGCHDHVPDRSQFRSLPGVRTQPEGDVRGNRARCPLDETAPALPVHVQGEGSSGLVPHS
ncbi:MAG TPA: FAD-dependent oxidoreductase [Acidimicrobiales bacterium]|nr:FAD-dependent oxidoreductase [Acidimicrobiales bacterium]